jgi:hypothetical protein
MYMTTRTIYYLAIWNGQKRHGLPTFRLRYNLATNIPAHWDNYGGVSARRDVLLKELNLPDWAIVIVSKIVQYENEVPMLLDDVHKLTNTYATD